MSCILRITDPLLKSILGKAEFKTIDELRVTFDNVANKHSILPLNINPPSKGFDIQKFGKVYKEGNEIKVQIVLPGQEYFSQFNLSSRLPEEMREVSFYGDTDDKTLTFDSLDSFLGFYLANFLYVTDTNYAKLAKGVTTILENVVGRLEGKTFKHAGAIEDLMFADSLVNYSKLLYNHAGLEEPPVVNQVYELIKDKWDRYHKNEVDQSRTQAKAEQNIQTFVKSDVKANLFFQAFDYVNGKENTKPLAQARRNLIRAIQDPSKYSVKLVQGSVTQAQQTDDSGNYPTVEMIERGVVGILIDENGNQLYLNKNNELTPNREEAISIDYEVDGVKNSSPEITLPFLNVHKALKEEFLQATPQQRETYIFKVENTKTQIEEKTFAEFNEVGKVEDILINIIADDPFAGISYLMKDGKQIIVDSTPLNEEEIQEVVELLEHTYEPDVLDKVVAYLNDLISVSDDRVKKEKTGKEIAFYAGENRILIKPLRIKEGDTYQSVESDPIDIRENKELILKSLRAARVRFRKREGASLQTSWSKWKMVDGVPKSFSVKREEGIKFYENHIKKVKVDQKTSSQIATFNQRAIPTKQEKPVIIGQLKVVKGKSYTIGEINQLVSPTFLEPEKTIWTTIYNSSKNTPRFIFQDYPESYPAYYDLNTNQIFVKYSQLLTNIQNEPAFLGRALAEELLHAVTVPLLDQYKDTVEYQRLQEDYQRAKELAKTYKETENYNKLTRSQKDKMDMIVNYYLQSFEEFVVGISHPYFRSFLKLGESRGLLEEIIDKVKKLLNKILKDVAPSLYTDTTTDLFNFIAKKPSELSQVVEIVNDTVIEQTQVSNAPESTSSVTFLQESLDLKIWKEIVDSGKYFTVDESDKERPIQYSDNPVGLYIFSTFGEESYEDIRAEVFERIVYGDDKEYTEVLSVQNLLDGLGEDISPIEKLRLVTYLKRLNKYLPGYFNYYLNQIQVDNKLQKQIYNQSKVEQIFNFSYLPGTQGAERVYTINYDNNLIGYAAIDNGNQIRWVTIRVQYEGMGLATKLINEIRRDDPEIKFKITLINNPQIFKISERLGGKKISETSVELPAFTVKPIELEFVQREVFVPQQARLFEPEIPLKKREKKSTESKEIKKYYTIPTAPEEIDLTLIQGLDAEIGKTLFSSGAFADFVQGNVETESVWQRMVNNLKEEYNKLVDAPSTQDNEDRLDWIDLFLEKENEFKKAWVEKSNLFLFNNDKLVINEDEIEIEEDPETSQEMESKDQGFNRVDSEQNKTCLQLGDPYAKMLVKLTPVGRVKGLTQLADFTNLWNRLQNLLANTISFDEQLKILSNTDNLVIVPEAPILIERLESIPQDVNGAIIINNFQRSFGTAQLPVYNTYFTKTDKGYDYSFFESAKLDVQNLEMLINQGFNEFAEPWKTTVRLGDREIPTYDLKQFLTYLEKSKDLVETYRKLGFPIPDMNKDRFIRESGLTNFHAGLIQIIKNRIGKWNGGDSKNTVILNGDLLTFVKSSATWEEFGGSIGTSPGLSTLSNRFISALAKYSPLTVSNMTKNAENQNQSILLSWSSWLISVKQLNDGECYRMKNPIFKYSLLSQLVDTDNQITPINLTGQRIQDGTGWDGTVSMSQNFIDYVRQEISNMMLSGTGEILRAETKQSSFGYKFKWGNSLHPINLENFKTDKWISDVSDIYISNKNEDVLKGYLKGELERIEIEKNNPVIYYPKYERIKGDFHLFTFLSQVLREKLTALSPQEAVDKYRAEIKEELINHFNGLVTELKQEVFNQTGVPLTPNHPILNVTQVQDQIKSLGFENFLRAFIVNRDIYQIEHFITGHGDIGQHDKPYKRFGSNISTGTPVSLNEVTQQVLQNTSYKQFRERIPTGKSFVITDDIYSYDNPKLVDDIEKSLTESYKRFGLDKTPKEIREEAVKKASKYLKTNVADGQGFMTPDFGRLVMIATGTWTNDREKGFWFQKIQHKQNKGIPLEAREQTHYDKVNEEIKERGIFWFFPPLKLQYRGEFIPNNETNVAIEGLDKFSLAWLWPDEMEGRVFEPILNKMMDEGYDYGKFESGTKIGTFKPDNLLQEIRNGNVDITIESGHDIDLTYMKEQVRAADKFKNQMPMSTQARKLVLSNLRFNGEYLSDSIGEAATEWKQSQAEISQENITDLMDRISTNGEIDNRKLADEIKEELKKRELPQSLTSIFTLYGEEFYQRFEQSLSPQLVETLIYSLLKNKVVRPKFPGEHYIMMSSSIFDRKGRELEFYEMGKPAQCKVVLSGEFLKLLNVKEITDYIRTPEVKPVYDSLSPYEQIENKRELLNQLLLDPIFVEKYKDSLTVFSSRIPGQGYNSMDIMTIQEFLPTYMGAVLVPYAQMPTKGGPDFDFDKIPTITPELTKTGKAKDSKVNRMLNSVARLILDPLNFHRLVTPNTTDEIDKVVANTLEALGENVSEPRFDKIFSFTTHLRKWMATKMKDALGIGATNNTFYTLLQDADAKLNKRFTIGDGWEGDVKFPFEREDKPMSYPLLQSGVDKLEFVNEFINITVDVASNDAIGYTGLKRDNSALLLFLLENGVDFADAFYFINQPIIIRYHQLLNQFKDQGYTSTEARNLTISKLLGITTQIDGGQRVQAQIYVEVDKMIKKEKFSNLLSTIARKDEVDKKWNTPTQKEYLAYYLIGLEMANKMREAQTYNNFDTRPSPNLLYSQARENSLEQIRNSGLFDLKSIQKIHNDSVISHLNVHPQFKKISEVAFKIKRDPRFTRESLRLSEFIYDQNDKENFFKKFDNDYLLTILQNYGTISKDKVEKNLRGELVEKWNKIKNEVKDLTISKYIVTNYSTKTPYSSLTLFLGLDGDSLTLDQIAKDLRVMLNSPNKEVKEFAKDFIETGLYTTGFTQSPVYYLKALPFEVINKYLKDAYDNYINLVGIQENISVSTYEGRITKLEDNQVFVFGSNPIGVNGNPSKGTGGAALVAHNIAGVKQGEKMDNKLSDSGKAWGITTVTAPGKPLSKTTGQIKEGIKKLYEYAFQNPDKEFVVAYQGKTGKNLNGYTNQQLADMFSFFPIPQNVKFEKDFSTLFTKDVDGISKETLIETFSDRFLFQRGMQFGQYFIPFYKANGIKNLDFKTKQALFNQEAWRYTDYKLSLKELSRPDITDMNQSITFQEHPSPNYQDRTGINAQADATIAFAVNFNSRGELRTKEEVTKKGKKYIPIDAKNKKVTPELVQRVVDELKSVNAESLNIAGNGIYEPGIGTQQEVDNFVFELLQQVTLQYPIQSIRTGGQTGYDEAGAKAGIRLGIPTIILAPKNWKFRDKSGTDISNEQRFKERFSVQLQPTQPKQLDLFEEQEQKDCDTDIPF